MQFYRILTLLYITSVIAKAEAFQQATHKIFFLISPPRCMSTATLRAMYNRGDFIVLNEPNTVTFFRLSSEGIGDDWEYQNNIPYKSYEEVIDYIINTSQQSNVFIKEMGFVAKEYMPHSLLLKNPNVYFVFLIRNPYDMIMAYYKVRGSAPLSNELSYKDLLELLA